ncbi:nucleoid occlusion factor SlmA, partial [Vibrio parahaemolyticus]|nr:nucleoid occlusion factor SlmA [Vibrio parahaemolyticus]
PVEERILAAQILGQVEGSMKRFLPSEFNYQPTANFDD